MAKSLTTYDSDAQYSIDTQKKIAAYQNLYAQAEAAGDNDAAIAYHNAAEQLRANDGLSTNTSSTSSNSSGEGLINDAYSQNLEAQKALLRSNYESDKAALARAEEEIAQTYTDKRNDAAGTKAQNWAAWNEYAAANGLNVGTSGQAALANANTYANNIASLNASESSAIADIELQRTQLKNEYSAAIAAAVADNNSELASALYDEYVRQDTLAKGEEQTAWERSKYEEETAYNRKQDEYNKLYTQAQILAQYGDFSGFRALGYTDEQIAAMESGYAKQNTPAVSYGTSGVSNSNYDALDADLSYMFKNDSVDDQAMFDYIMAFASDDATAARLIGKYGLSDYANGTPPKPRSDNVTPNNLYLPTNAGR